MAVVTAPRLVTHRTLSGAPGRRARTKRRRTAWWQVRCGQTTPLSRLVQQIRRTRPSRCTSPGRSSTRSDHSHLKTMRFIFFLPPISPVNPCPVVLPTADNPLCRHALRTDNSLKALGLPQRPVPFPKHLHNPQQVVVEAETIAGLQASTRSSPPRPLQVVMCTSLRGRSPIGRDTQKSWSTCIRVDVLWVSTKNV